jgi:hypothetical protein
METGEGPRPVRPSSFNLHPSTRLAGLIAGGLLFAVVLTVALFWIGLALAALVGLGLLHLVYLPRAAAFLRRPVGQLVIALLPVLALVGWAIAGAPSGALAGLLAWTLALAAPRLAAAHLAGRLRLRTAIWSASDDDRRPSGTIVTLSGSTCPDCGQVAYGPATAACARCGAPLTRAPPG